MKLQTRKLCVSKRNFVLQLSHLMSFRVLKNNLYLARYNMRRKETDGHMWLCSVVAKEASREARGWGFARKCRDLRLRVAG
jgi:hypothetical protein